MVTTWPSTPLTCRPAKLPWRSMDRAPPFVGRVSIGVVRSNTRLVACVPPKFIFRTVQAHERAPAGTRRAITVATGLTASGSFFRPCLSCLCDRRQCEPVAPRTLLLSSAIKSQRRKTERFVRPAAGLFAWRFRTPVGILAKHHSVARYRIGRSLYVSLFTSSATPAS